MALALAAAALSGLLMAAAMPTLLDWGAVLGWVGLVPLLVVITRWPDLPVEPPTLLCGLLWSLAAHLWYPNVLGGWAVALIVGVGAFYGMVIRWGVGLSRRFDVGRGRPWCQAAALLALPVVWTACEFLRFVAPVTRDWWFVLLAKTQWRNPAALQVLSLTGFPGLSLLVMLANVALARLVATAWRTRRLDRGALVALTAVGLIVGAGGRVIPASPADSFAVAATVDLANQDDAILALSASYTGVEGPYADTPEQSRALFEVNGALTRQAAALTRQAAALTRPAGERALAFVVWPENEFCDADDPTFVNQLGALSREMGAYIVADTVWRTPNGLHDTALLMGPDGAEAGRRAKIHVVGGELDHGFVPGPRQYPVFATPHGDVGLGVCYDYHYLDVVRGLARAGADLMLMPTDDDFHGDPWFPRVHATDAVFRAVEHRVAFAVGAANGVALVVDPHGRLTAESGVNRREVVVGETHTVARRTPYTALGDWFGWLTVAATACGVLVPRGHKQSA